MAPNADGPGLLDTLSTLERKAAESASTMWGMMLDHLSDKHAKAVAARKVDPEGGVARTADGVVVTSKELVMQVFLNAEGNYSVSGYQERMSKSIGPIYLGMDWGPEYEKLSTAANAAIGGVTRREAFDFALKETRAALAALPDPGAVDIQAISDVVLAGVCAHWFDVPDGEFDLCRRAGFGCRIFSRRGAARAITPRLRPIFSIPTRMSCSPSSARGPARSSGKRSASWWRRDGEPETRRKARFRAPSSRFFQAVPAMTTCWRESLSGR
jgi:hypothetical protein